MDETTQDKVTLNGNKSLKELQFFAYSSSLHHKSVTGSPKRGPSENSSTTLKDDLENLQQTHKKNIVSDEKTLRAMTKTKDMRRMIACRNYMDYLAKNIIIPLVKTSSQSHLFKSTGNLAAEIAKDSQTRFPRIGALMQNIIFKNAINRYIMLQGLLHAIINNHSDLITQQYQKIIKTFSLSSREKIQEMQFLDTAGDKEAKMDMEKHGIIKGPVKSR